MNMVRSPGPIRPAALEPPHPSLYLSLGHMQPGVSPSVWASLLPSECKGLQQIAVACGRAVQQLAQWGEVGGEGLLPWGRVAILPCRLPTCGLTETGAGVGAGAGVGDG